MLSQGRLHALRLFARSASVYIKIGAAIVGFIAAYLWYRSAVAGTMADAVDLNMRAAVVTALSVMLQGLSAAIDAWIPPTASWA